MSKTYSLEEIEAELTLLNLWEEIDRLASTIQPTKTLEEICAGFELPMSSNFETGS